MLYGIVSIVGVIFVVLAAMAAGQLKKGEVAISLTLAAAAFTVLAGELFILDVARLVTVNKALIYVSAALFAGFMLAVLVSIVRDSIHHTRSQQVIRNNWPKLRRR